MKKAMDCLRPQRGARLFLFVLACAALGHAGQTRSWVETDYSDFEKGISHNLSLRSDGLLTLAPKFQELYDTSSTYLWALAHDSKGNLYAGGGPGAKIYRLDAKGGKKVLAELEGLAVQALAVDKADRLYAATSPDGKVYRISQDGKPEVYYDPKAKYIWAMAFDASGDLFVATGDHGEVHKVTPDGKGAVFFRTDETHARSMAIDGAGNLIVGTEPGGLVIRVSPQGQGFVLYQTAKREVTAVSVARDGSIYAAAVGNKQPVRPVPALQPLPAAPVQTTSASAVVAAGRPAVPVPPTLAGPGGSVTGGSEVYRIDSKDNPRKVWSNSHDVVYAIAFDGDGRVLLGTGNKGYIYRIDSATLYTVVLNGSSTQVTGFEAGRGGRLFAVTSNVGKIYEIGPGLEHEGTIESDVFDAGAYSQWGRLSFDGKAEGGQIRMVARSGNLDQPQKNWSPWSAAVVSTKGDRVNSPSARFVQWKATLTAATDGRSPELDGVELAYLPKNIEPRLEDLEITPSNYKFPPPVILTPSAPVSLTLPPLGRHQQPSRTASVEGSAPTMQYSKGWLGARWNASDENGDRLVYTVQIKGEQESEWKTLKDDLREKYFSFDSTAFPDGEYRVRVIASDAPSNAPPEALTTAAASEPFLIDNTPPRITELAATRTGNKLNVHWKASDALTYIEKAEYSLDGGEWTPAPPVGGLSDSLDLGYDLTLENVPPGEHTLTVRVQDEYENQSAAKTVVK